MIEPVHFPPYNGDRKKYDEDNRLGWAGDEDAKRRLATASEAAWKTPDVLLTKPKARRKPARKAPPKGWDVV